MNHISKLKLEKAHQGLVLELQMLILSDQFIQISSHALNRALSFQILAHYIDKPLSLIVQQMLYLSKSYLADHH